MTTPSADSELCLLAPREPLPAEAQRQMWRVRSGAVRIDSASADETGRFMRLALPGDVIGVEQWAGTNDHLSLRALIDTSLTPVEATAGGVSSLPSVHGLADDRLRIQVDGMDLVSACGNHMNPPLSYIDPTRVGSVRLFAGITPVSVGGDSIGATIQVESPAPEFAARPGPAAPGRGWRFLSQQRRRRGPQPGGHLRHRADEPALRRLHRRGRQLQGGPRLQGRRPCRQRQASAVAGGRRGGIVSYKTRNHSLTYACAVMSTWSKCAWGCRTFPTRTTPTSAWT
jgi:hypothetical protein